MTKSRQHIIKGVALGTIIPAVVGLVIKLLFYDYIPFSNLYHYPQMLSPFIQWGIVGNMLLFFYAMQKKRTYLQQGIVIATLVYAFLAILFKFYW